MQTTIFQLSGCKFKELLFCSRDAVTTDILLFKTHSNMETLKARLRTIRTFTSRSLYTSRPVPLHYITTLLANYDFPLKVKNRYKREQDLNLEFESLLTH